MSKFPFKLAALKNRTKDKKCKRFLQSFHTIHTEKAGTIAAEKVVNKYCAWVKKRRQFSGKQKKSKHLGLSPCA